MAQEGGLQACRQQTHTRTVAHTHSFASSKTQLSAARTQVQHFSKSALLPGPSPPLSHLEFLHEL